MTATDGGSPPCGGACEQQCRRGEEANYNSRLTRLVGTVLELSDHGINSFFGLGLGQTGSRCNDLGKIGPVGSNDASTPLHGRE